jgi:biopolymer transport protein TolQ
VFAFFVFLQEAAAEPIVQGSVLDLVMQTGPVAKGVLLALLAFSIFSWAIIYTKWKRFKTLRVQSEVFLRAFRKARRLSEFNIASENFPPHPMKAVFESGYQEVCAQVGNPGGPVHNPVAVQRSLQIASAQQLSDLEQNLNWLATTGAITPFIGLFGTVWGIMDAFLGLGSGAASLRAVGPGIAEALVTTAAGLFVAVPAVIAYNQFLNRVREMGTRMDSFALEFLNAAERG